MQPADSTRRQHILEVAAQSFAQRHYHEARMDDIAEQAGVAKGTIYRYFHDKEDLYLALILSGLQRHYDEVKTAIAGAAQPEEQILIYVQRTLEFFEAYPYFLDLVQRVEVSSHAKKLEPLQASRQRFFQLVSDIIVSLTATGRFHADDPALTALALTGMTRQILRFSARPRPPRLAETIVHQFLHGLHFQKSNAIAPPRRRNANRTRKPALAADKR